MPWTLGVFLPLVAVALLLVFRRRDVRAVRLAVGLIGGVTLIQVEQVLSTTALAADPDTGANAGGTGWWLAVLGTAVLVACLIVVVRRGVFRAGPGVAGGWRSLLGIVLVVGALFLWLAAFGDFYLWWPANGAALLMAAVALPVVVLALNDAQRVAALVAVTVFGASIVVSVVHSNVVDTYWSDASRGIAVVISAVLSVLGCYVAQARLPRRAPERL